MMQVAKNWSNELFAFDIVKSVLSFRNFGIKDFDMNMIWLNL